MLVTAPASVKRSNQEWSLGIILNEASTRAGSAGVSPQLIGKIEL